MPIRLAAVQFRRPETGDPHLALSVWADKAARSADLVVLPEMAASGYVFADRGAIEAVAESPKGPTFQVLSQVARTQHCWIVAGYPERDRDRFFNSACVINPAGELAFTYRKTLLYEADERWATPGNSGYRTFETDGGSFSVGICMDLNDEAFIQWLQSARPDVLAFPTNWVYEDDADVWSYWAWRMGQLSTTLVAANTFGVEEGVRFTGRSLILRDRVVMAHAPVEGNSVIWANHRPSASAPPS